MGENVLIFLMVTVLRGLVTLVGLAFCILGYKLFVKGVYEKGGELKAAWGDKNLALKQAGPGTFFALFGLLTVGIGIWRDTGLQYKPADVVDGVETSKRTAGDPITRSPILELGADYETPDQLIEKASPKWDEEWAMAERAVLYNTYIRVNMLGIPSKVYNDFVNSAYVPVLKQKPGEPRFQNLELAHKTFFAGFEGLSRPIVRSSAPKTKPVVIKDGLGPFP